MGSQVELVIGPADTSSGEPVVQALMEPVTATDFSAGAFFCAERRSARFPCGWSADGDAYGTVGAIKITHLRSA